MLGFELYANIPPIHIWEGANPTEYFSPLFVFNLNLFYFWLHWFFVAVRAFSSCGEWGLLFLMCESFSFEGHRGSRLHRLQYLWVSGSGAQAQ